jgi:catecholate siderophore receptor
MSATCYLPRIALAASAGLGALGWAGPALAEDEASAIIDNTVTATKTQTPLIDVPQAVSVISREQLDDQAILTLGDALRFVPGVTLGLGEGHRDQITLRGQSSTADFFVDGIRDDAQYYRPLYNVEQVEVLKGANALIFGRGGGGGVINRVSKAPEFGQLKGSVAGGLDTLGAWSVALDLGAPLVDGLGLRFNNTYEAFNSHRQDYEGHFFGITPTLGARLGEATTATFTYEYVEDRRLTDRGVPSRTGLPLTGFDKTLFGSPAANFSEVTAHLVHGRIDHEFSGNLSANLSVQYAHYDKFYSNLFAGGSVSATNTVLLSGYNSGAARENLIGQSNLVWKGSTGAIGHTLLLGFEVGDQSSLADRRNAVFPSGATVTLAERITLPTVTFPALTSASNSDASFWSVYAQDQLDLGEHVKIVGGLRYDRFKISSVNLVTGFAGERSDDKWSPRVGLILKPRTNVSIYASYSRSFLPQSGDQFTVLDATTEALAPEEFRNLEAGVKWDISDALAFTGAVYRLDRSNARATDPISGSTVLSGKTRAEGIEFSLVGHAAKGLDLSLGYALQNGEIRATTTAAPAGRKLAQLPRHQVSGWARYNVSKRFGLGLGVIHQSSQFTTISNAVRLPAFTRIDAAVFFNLNDRISLQVNVENLTDADYFPSAHTDNNISTAKPLNAKATMRVKF